MSIEMVCKFNHVPVLFGDSLPQEALSRDLTKMPVRDHRRRAANDPPLEKIRDPSQWIIMYRTCKYLCGVYILRLDP
jgi:hypothetical protein